jgi:hypothetical protein
MDDKRTLNHRLATMAWGVLLIWWGVVIVIDPLTIGIGAIGTGLILLGVNAIRSWKGIPPKNGNNLIGIIAIVWGALDQARHMLALPLELSFASLLIVIGLVELIAPLFAHPNLPAGDRPGDV